MASRRLLVMLPLLALMLTGCFRQASEPSQRVAEAPGLGNTVPTTVPASPTEEPTLLVPTDVIESPTTTVTETPVATEVDETPTLSADAQSVQETATEIPTETATDEPTALILPPTNTPFPSETAVAPVTFVMFTATPIPSSTALPTETPIIPTNTGVPQATNTVTPSPTAQIEQPGLITPSGPGSGQSAIVSATPNTLASPQPTIPPTPTDAFFQEEDETPEESSSVPDECIYVVRAGDNLFRIALNNDASLDDIINANPGINPQIILPGDEIVLPNCGDDEPEENAPSQEATNDDDGTAASDQDNSATNAIPLEGDDDQGIIGGIETIHVVQPGETLSVIARRYGVSITAIAERNNLSNTNRLTIDQRLIIPPPNN